MHPNVYDGYTPQFEHEQMLTERQLQIARYAAAGLENKLIAQRLNLSHQTIKNVLEVVFAKTGCVNRIELAVFLLYHGLADLCLLGESVDARRREALLTG